MFFPKILTIFDFKIASFYLHCTSVFTKHNAHMLHTLVLSDTKNKTYSSSNSPLVAGKKGRVMERRILKDFQIGFVEGILNEQFNGDNKPVDVFSTIAKAIGGKTSAKKYAVLS